PAGHIFTQRDGIHHDWPAYSRCGARSGEVILIWVKQHSSTATAPRRLRDRLRDAAHEAILDAAEEAFARHGMDAPMEAIASLAGVAVGTLYNHFDSRAALLEALMSA